MNLYRRFLRYLARDEITAAHAAGYAECASISELAKSVAYAEGEAVGSAVTLQQIHNVVAERTNGNGGLVTDEDVEMAKKGRLH